MLLPKKRTGGLPMAMLMGPLLTAFGGFWITEFFDTDQEVGFVALALGPLWPSPAAAAAMVDMARATGTTATPPRATATAVEATAVEATAVEAVIEAQGD